MTHSMNRALAIDYLDKIQRAVDGRNDMVWAAFQYQCERCGNIEWIYLGVGVEGPPELRDRAGYIPSPLMGPLCLLCKGKGATKHVRWREDKTFPPIDATDGVRYYRFPRKINEETIRFFDSSCFCGEMAIAPRRRGLQEVKT